MQRPTGYRRSLCRWGGVLLLMLGLFFGYWWFYKLGPMRHTLDPRWVARHSEQEHWREVQRSIRRGMWLHDDAFTVGFFGDKSWAQWIVSHVKPGTSMGCPTHEATAMRYITNQDAGENANAWLARWEKNQSKTQAEWIAEGFAQRGFAIDVPPKPEQIPTVLALLGNAETDEQAIPEGMKYNGLRCLRDSGFDPIGFALANHPISADIERGLLEYGKWQRRWPEGIVEDFPRPGILAPEIQAGAYALVFVPLALGSVLLLWSFRKKKPGAKPSPEPDGDETRSSTPDSLSGGVGGKMVD